MGTSEFDRMTGRYYALQDRYQRLNTEIQLLEIVQDLRDSTREAAGLISDVGSIRRRGYVYAPYLEHKAALLYEHWQAALDDIQHVLDERVTALQEEYKQLEIHSAQLSQHLDDVSAMNDRLPIAETAAAALESKIREADIHIKQMYAALERDINQAIEQIQEIHWLLDQRDGSSLVYQPGESLFMGILATLYLSSANFGEGVLYLTNQRLLFERKATLSERENADTGQAAHAKVWGIDLVQVEDVQVQRTGTIDAADSLNISYLHHDGSARVTVAIHEWAKCKLWAAHIRRLCFGDAADERMLPLDDEFLATNHGAPTICHVCGAGLSSGAADSQKMSCGYCGAVISW